MGHLARKICNNLNLERDEENLIVAAALLHDIGHGPYSHTLEKILIEKKGYGHTEISKQMITGNIKQDSETIRDKPRLSDILIKYNLESEKVADLVRGDSERDDPCLETRRDPGVFNLATGTDVRAYVQAVGYLWASAPTRGLTTLAVG